MVGNPREDLVGDPTNSRISGQINQTGTVAVTCIKRPTH